MIEENGNFHCSFTDFHIRIIYINLFFFFFVPPVVHFSPYCTPTDKNFWETRNYSYINLMIVFVTRDIWLMEEHAGKYCHCCEITCLPK